jgi:hypothetical protein
MTRVILAVALASVSFAANAAWTTQDWRTYNQCTKWPYSFECCRLFWGNRCQ